jgi:adenylate cyclase
MDPQRKLAAILFTDIEGYTLMMQRDETHAMMVVQRHQEVMEKLVDQFKGEVLNNYGDGSLSIFPSVTGAVRCAFEMQKLFLGEPFVPLRIGIHVGEVLFQEDKVFGDGVNIASRIESLGQPGTVLFSREVLDKIENKPEFQTRPIGKFRFKNVERPLEVFALTNPEIRRPDIKSLKGKLSQEGKLKIRKLVIPIAAVLVILIALSIVFYWKDSPFADVDKSIAVLPFDNLSNDPEQEYFSDGITEDILTQLSKIGALHVISRTSVMQYKEKTKSIKDIAEELGVNYILEGSVRRSGNDLRVTAQLIDARTDSHIWAEDFDKEVQDIFAVQRDVAMEVARAMRAQLTPDEAERVGTLPNVSTQVYDLYQKGLDLIHRGGGTKSELDEALSIFEDVTKMAPDFALAYAGLANTYLEYLFWQRAPVGEITPKAIEPALKALELDNRQAECYAALGGLRCFQYEFETGQLYLEKALDLNPNYAPAMDWLAWLYFVKGDEKKGMAMMDRAISLDPLSTKYKASKAQAYLVLGQYNESERYIKNALKRHPGDNFLLWVLANLYAIQGDYDLAIETFHSRTAGTNTNWCLGHTYGVSGQLEEARRILDYHLKKQENEYVPTMMIGFIYLGLGDIDTCFDLVTKELQAGGHLNLILAIGSDPRWAPLFREQRFKQLWDNQIGLKTWPL